MALSRAGRTPAGTPAPSDIRDVLAAFGLDLASTEVTSPLVSGGGVVTGARLRSDGREWALKEYSTSSALERLAMAHTLEARLAAAGFPVAALHTGPAGETIVGVGAASYSMHEWVDGQHLSIVDRDVLTEARPHLVRELGGLIATLHAISSQIPFDGPPTDPDRLLTGSRAALRQIRWSRRRWLSRWQRLRLKSGKSDFDRWVLDVLPEVARRADDLATTSIASRVEPSEVGLIHNDINWENLVLDKEFRVEAVIDFDNVTRAPWVLEVGAAAVVLAGAAPHKVEEFVSAYEDVAGRRLDRDLVRLGMKMKCVRSITTSIVAHLDGRADPRRLAPWCRDLQASLRALDQT